MVDTKEEKEAWAGQRIEEVEAKKKSDEEWYAGERKAKGEAVPVVSGFLCGCGKPVEKESPQIDQCLACFNRA